MTDGNPWTSVADQIAALATSGLVRRELSNALHERFPTATRSEVFFGFAMAVSIFEADRLELVCELLQADAKLAALQAESANV